MSTKDSLKSEILRLTREYSRLSHSGNFPASDSSQSSWIPGDPIPYAGRVFKEEEVVAAVSTTLDFWLTLGVEGAAFESELASYLGIRRALLVNSGSSANLIALSIFTSGKLPKSRRILPGDQVITVAAGFPTTVAPIVQIGAVPVFLDVNPITGNICVEQLDDAYNPGKTKAICLAHALGNPFDLACIIAFCKKHDLWLIEDNCDALGSTYSMPREVAQKLGFNENSPGLFDGSDRIIRWTGAWGDVSTQSFYPPHHLTMGEGGSVNIIRDQKLNVIAESFRDWGRDCWCPSGIDNTCRKRFDWQLGELPSGYDHKYTYSHLGYNLKPLDPQAAIGRVQLQRLPEFIKQRKKNWEILRSGLSKFNEFLDFALPTHSHGWDSRKGFLWDQSECRTDCSWFGFKIDVKPSAPFTRRDLVNVLDAHAIGHRMFFGGNLVRQPAFVQLKKDNPHSLITPSPLTGSDYIMNRSLFLGTYPGLTTTMLDYEVEVISSFIENF